MRPRRWWFEANDDEQRVDEIRESGSKHAPSPDKVPTRSRIERRACLSTIVRPKRLWTRSRRSPASSSLTGLRYRTVRHRRETGVFRARSCWPILSSALTSSPQSSIGPAALALFRQAVFSLSGSHPSSACPELAFPTLFTLANDKINSFPYHSVPETWRRLYTEVGIAWTLSDLLSASDAKDEDPGKDQDRWLAAVARLDMVLIVAGAPGDGRRDFVDDLIALTQALHLPTRPWSPGSEEGSVLKKPRLISRPPAVLSLAPAEVPSISPPPSISGFVQSHLSRPFILRGFLRETGWPALDPSTPWNRRDYLLSVTGRGRIVPVEVGAGDYTHPDWGQGMAPFEEFLERIGWPSGDEKDSGESTGEAGDPLPPLYLAQHSLLSQFPRLNYDILQPDYIYSAPPETDTYHPPANEDGVLVNVWVGGEGRCSPAHTVRLSFAISTRSYEDHLILSRRRTHTITATVRHIHVSSLNHGSQLTG